MPTITHDTTLVVGDAHVAPGQNLRRFQWANKFVKDCKPTRILLIGDFGNFDAFSAWDKDKRKMMEGRRYLKDVEVCNEALGMLLEGVDNRIPLVYTEGNHENRVDRYLEYHPELLGKIDVQRDILAGVAGTREVHYVKYKQDWTHRGVSFTHVPIQENGKPVAGKYATQKALSIYQNSVVFGHTHRWDVACEHRHNATHLNQALNVGCFFEHVDEYAKGSVTSYWRGLVLLDHYSNNRFDIATYSLGKLRDLYT